MLIEFSARRALLINDIANSGCFIMMCVFMYRISINLDTLHTHSPGECVHNLCMNSHNSAPNEFFELHQSRCDYIYYVFIALT